MPPGIPKHNGLPRLFVIRHGDTDWTDTQRHTGLTDIPLNARGEERARQLQSRLAGQSFAQVFCSPLLRAKRTCELAGLSTNITIDPNLVEWDYGRYEGQTTAEILEQRPDWNLFRDGAPSGESPEQVAARVDQFLGIARSIEGDVAAFSSGHTIRMIAARWLGLAPFNAKYFFSATAGISVVGYEHDRNQPVIQLWNDVG